MDNFASIFINNYMQNILSIGGVESSPKGKSEGYISIDDDGGYLSICYYYQNTDGSPDRIEIEYCNRWLEFVESKNASCAITSTQLLSYPGVDELFAAYPKDERIEFALVAPEHLQCVL